MPEQSASNTGISSTEHITLALGQQSSAVLRDQLKQRNLQQKAQNCEECGTEQTTQKDTCSQCELKQEGRVLLLSVTQVGTHDQGDSSSCALCMPKSARASAALKPGGLQAQFSK